jgi:hypothetical protein
MWAGDAWLTLRSNCSLGGHKAPHMPLDLGLLWWGWWTWASQTHLHTGGAALHSSAEHDSGIFRLFQLNSCFPQANWVWNMLKGYKRSSRKRVTKKGNKSRCLCQEHAAANRVRWTLLSDSQGLQTYLPLLWVLSRQEPTQRTEAENLVYRKDH